MEDSDDRRSPDEASPPPYLDNKYLFSARIQKILSCRKYSRCNSGICAVCYKRKSGEQAGKIAGILDITADFDALLSDPVHLHRAVFTQANRSGDLKQRVNRLYSSLAELLKPRSLFRTKYLLGGVWRLHVGYSANAEDWNLHFDTILETRKMPMGTLAAEWQRICSSRVRVQTVRRDWFSFERLSGYVTKLPFQDFAVRDVESASKNAALLETYADAVRRRRKITNLGTWRRRPRRI